MTQTQAGDALNASRVRVLAASVPVCGRPLLNLPLERQRALRGPAFELQSSLLFCHEFFALWPL
jgi:hypothetical protein